MEETGKQTAVRARAYLVNLGLGFHEVTRSTKEEIRERLHIEAGAYDLIKLPAQNTAIGQKLITPRYLTDQDYKDLLLVEVKSSNRNLPKGLDDYFFSLQYSEQLTAQKLGERYIFAFVVLSGRKQFHRLLTWQDIWANAKTLHMQWSIRLRTVAETSLENAQGVSRK